MKNVTEDGLCSVENCKRPHHAKGYCQLHLRRKRSGRDLQAPLQINDPSRKCLYESCRGAHHSGGYCKAHYEQVRTGRPLTAVQRRPKFDTDLEKFWEHIRVTEEGCWEWKLKAGGHGYGVISTRSGQKTCHVFAYEEFKGEIPAGMQIDHQCRNRKCANPDHLKAVTIKENRENMGLSPKNTSGYRGVSKSKRSGKWVASVTHNGKQFKKGGFATPEEANEYAVALRLELYTNNVDDRLRRQ